MSANEKHDAQGGFTLLEMAFVFLLSSFFMLAAFQAYELYTKNRLLNEAREKQEFLATSIARYAANAINSRLPCPADPTLPFNDPNAGREDCAMLDVLVPMDTCSGPGNTGICKVGGRDTTADGDVDPDPILIGAIPYKTIKEGIEDTVVSFDDPGIMTGLDPWGFRMTYVVTGALTSSATYQAPNGAITVVTEDGIDLTDPPDSAHYMIIAHGENHMGAYNTYGNVPFTCTAGLDETDNCDNNSSFVAGLRSTVPGSADYFDDTVWHTAFSMSRIWDFVPGTGNIVNLNVGNVGVGTNNPVERLHIVGDFRGDEISLDLLCDTNGTSCWDPENLGSNTGTRCPATPAPAAGMMRVVQGVIGGEVDCIDIPMLTTGTTQSCAGAGEYVVGFDATGAIICEVP